MIGNSITGWGGTVLSYDINGGTGTTPASDPSLNGFSTTNVATGAGFSKAGYTFGGWNCNQSIGIKAAGASLSMPHDPAAVDVLCTAIWTATAYQLSYDAGGGTGTSGSAAAGVSAGGSKNAIKPIKPKKETRGASGLIIEGNETPAADLVGYMPLRGEFDTEWENDAEYAAKTSSSTTRTQRLKKSRSSRCFASTIGRWTNGNAGATSCSGTT